MVTYIKWCLILAAVVLVAKWADQEGWLLGEDKIETGRGMANIGEPLYAELCADCHGEYLQGKPAVPNSLLLPFRAAPTLDQDGDIILVPDNELILAVKRGLKRGEVKTMPGFDDKLNNRQVHAVLAYVKRRWSSDTRLERAIKAWEGGLKPQLKDLIAPEYERPKRPKPKPKQTTAPAPAVPEAAPEAAPEPTPEPAPPQPAGN